MNTKLTKFSPRSEVYRPRKQIKQMPIELYMDARMYITLVPQPRPGFRHLIHSNIHSDNLGRYIPMVLGTHLV